MVEEKIPSTWKIWVIWTSSLNLCHGNIRLLCGQKFFSLCLRLIFPVSICPLSSELKLLPHLFRYEGTCGLWWECTLGKLMVGSHSWLSRKGASKEQAHEKKRSAEVVHQWPWWKFCPCSCLQLAQLFGLFHSVFVQKLLSPQQVLCHTTPEVGRNHAMAAL